MLPKIKSPIYDVTIPSTGKTVKVRPFEVKEEKILLMARQSGEPADFFSSISQIVQNCVLDEKVNVLTLPLFDVEYIFTKIRVVSVNNISKVSYMDNEDQQTYDFNIDLDKVEVKFPEAFSDRVILDKKGATFKVNGTITFTMKYPPMKTYADKEFFDLDEDATFNKLVTTCLEKVFEGESAHSAVDSSEQEILDFINSLPAKFYSDIRQFFTNLPSLYNEVKYTNKNGKEVTIRQRTIEDFFTFG